MEITGGVKKRDDVSEGSTYSWADLTDSSERTGYRSTIDYMDAAPEVVQETELNPEGIIIPLTPQVEPQETQGSGVAMDIVERVPTDVLAVSPDKTFVFLRFRRGDGAVEKQMPLDAVRNAGMAMPSANDQYEFRVIESGAGYFGRFVRKVSPTLLESESEMPLMPDMNDLKEHLEILKRPEGEHS